MKKLLLLASLVLLSTSAQAETPFEKALAQECSNLLPDITDMIEGMKVAIGKLQPPLFRRWG